MEGIFLRKKFNICLFLLFLCGLFFIGLYIFLNIVDTEANSGLPTFLILGILICLFVILSWLLNFGAFIRIDNDSIKAKYHYFGKIDCKLTYVDFASARVNTLIIKLKNGKCHTIMGIKNSWELSSLIRRNVSFESTEQPERLIQKLNNLKLSKKKSLIYVCSGLALMFINIFATVFLTGEREMHEFSKFDWIIFTIMGVIEIVTVIATFYFAKKTGKNNIPIEQTKYAIQRTIIETKPLLSGFLIAVYADENYSARITVFGYPHQNAVYYTVEKFASDFTLLRVYSSEIYEDIEDVPHNLDALIDITEKVLHKKQEMLY